MTETETGPDEKVRRITVALSRWEILEIANCVNARAAHYMKRAGEIRECRKNGGDHRGDPETLETWASDLRALTEHLFTALDEAAK